MKNMKTTSKTTTLIMAVVEVIIGILLLVKPEGFTRGIITFMGVVLVVMGAGAIWLYFKAKPAEAAAGQGLARGLIEIVFGVFCVANSGWFITAFPVLTMLYGVGTLLSGLIKVQWTVDMLRMKAKKWWWAAISAALTLICAAIIIGNPFTTTVVLWMFIAVTLIMEAVVDILVAVLVKNE